MKLNRNTEKARNFIERYYWSRERTLADCYLNFSKAKAIAEAQCREKMLGMDGHGFKIISFNSMTFTCGWLFEDKETGVIMLNVETAHNSYQVEY